jgi:hypothetical protein
MGVRGKGTGGPAGPFPRSVTRKCASRYPLVVMAWRWARVRPTAA